MAGPAADSSENRRDLNAVFQRLVCVLGYDRVDALDEIFQKLCRGRLPVTFHIRGGVRKPGRDECAPAEGITGPVLPEAWIHGTMQLHLAGDQLTVRINGAILGFAWCDTFFDVDWHIVEQIWPLPVTAVPVSMTVLQIWPPPMQDPVSGVGQIEPPPAVQDPAIEAPKKPLPQAQQIVWEVLRHEWPPDGMNAHAITTAEIERRVRVGWPAACKRLGLPLHVPKPNQRLRDTVDRAMGRRRD